MNGPSALGSARRAPSWEIVVSLAAHVGLAVVLIAGELLFGHDPKPLIDPDQVMQISAVALPKPTSNLPDKVMHTPEPVEPDPVPAAPEAEPSPEPPEPPPEPAEMALPDPKKDKKVEKVEKVDKAAEKKREDDKKKALDAARKQALLTGLRDMGTPEGDRNSPRTDPNGVDPKDAILDFAGVGPTDPELARYYAACKAALLPNWTPLPSTVSAHPNYKVVVMVEVEADGTLGQPKVLKGTGDATFDRSAALAISKTGRFPPPPAKYRAAAQNGVQIEFVAKDKL